MAQNRQPPVFQDSSTSRLHQINSNTVVVDPYEEFFQSGFTPSIGGFSNAGDVNALCGRPYQNRTGVPITVTVVPGTSKDRITYLHVKQTPGSPWVLMAYSQNSIPASVQVRNGALYCPTMNENGYFYVTVERGGPLASLPAYYAAPYLLWTDEAVQPGLYVEDPRYGCQNISTVRTTYSNGQTPASRIYIFRYGGVDVAVSSQVYFGACPYTPPRDPGDGE